MALCGLVFILLEFHPTGYINNFLRNNFFQKQVISKKMLNEESLVLFLRIQAFFYYLFNDSS